MDMELWYDLQASEDLPMITRAEYTLKECAEKITGGNLVTMAKLLNDANPRRPFDELSPDPDLKISRQSLVDLVVFRAADDLGYRVSQLL